MHSAIFAPEPGIPGFYPSLLSERHPSIYPLFLVAGNEWGNQRVLAKINSIYAANLRYIDREKKIYLNYV